MIPTSPSAASWADAVALDPRLAGFKETDPDRGRVVCALHGHSAMHTFDNDEASWQCRRCGEFVGGFVPYPKDTETVEGRFWYNMGVHPVGTGFLWHRI